MRDGAHVGVSTSRCYSYYFQQMLSLCVIDVASASRRRPACAPFTPAHPRMTRTDP
jgi:hypothetical protein